MIEGGADRNQTWSVWVRASFSNYKAAYLAFISRAYGATVGDNDLPGYDVDHLSNRVYAPTGQEFIRLEAIPQEANNRWGANFEARRTANTDSKPMKLLSYMSCAKLAGLLPPAGPNDTAASKCSSTTSSQSGLSAKQLARLI